MKTGLLENINKLHTTELGILRIKRNLEIETDNVVSYCRKLIMKSTITRKGKNWYADTGKEIITVNASNYSIITAHKAKGS
jgi:hypothetical protein